MSSTRKAQPGTPLRQERFASNPLFERGLLANLVAQRCELLSDPRHQRLIWFIQAFSHKQSLSVLAQRLVTKFQDGIGTSAMQRIGVTGSGNYNADQVRQIRAEIPQGPDMFPLRGELTDQELILLPDVSRFPDWTAEADYARARVSQAQTMASNRPTNYPVQAFRTACLKAANEGLADYLAEICLNPEVDLGSDGPWYFPGLFNALEEVQAEWIADQGKHQVCTDLGKRVWAAMDYGLQSQSMVLIDGMARLGKTFAVRAWCSAHPGEARYVQVPSSSDEIGFFRAIAKSLGVSINLNSKAAELRNRVEDTLQRAKLMLVLDEAHYLWPSTAFRDSRLRPPGRVNWLMTALVNFGVPVALITTPQFIRTQKLVEKHTNWTSEQFIGRIGHYEKLPDKLGIDDLQMVVKALLPMADPKSIAALANYALISSKHLAAIESAAKRAKYVASQAGRDHPRAEDVRTAIKESVMPSDNALCLALAPQISGRSRVGKPLADLEVIGRDESEQSAGVTATHGRGAVPLAAGADDLISNRSRVPDLVLAQTEEG